MPKRIGVRKANELLKIVNEVIRTAKMESCSFNSICGEGQPLPTSEKEVTEFIKQRTDLWRETWIINELEKVAAELKTAGE